MSKADDITNLFRRFGGDAGTYREIVEHEQADRAQRAWPMLGQVQPNAHAEAPPAMSGLAENGLRQRQTEEPVRSTGKAPLHFPRLDALPPIAPPVAASPHADPDAVSVAQLQIEPVVEAVTEASVEAAEVVHQAEAAVPAPALVVRAAATPVDQAPLVPLVVPSPVQAAPTPAPAPAPYVFNTKPLNIQRPEPLVPLFAATPAPQPIVSAARSVPIAPVMPAPIPFVQPVAPAAPVQHNGLKQMFARMSRPPVPPARAGQASDPLKRLVKW